MVQRLFLRFPFDSLFIYWVIVRIHIAYNLFCSKCTATLNFLNIFSQVNGKSVIPILVAAGGGGLGYNASANILPHGRGLNVTLDPHSGITQTWGAGII